MALKYFCEYPDMVNIIHRFEIYDDNFVDTPIEINGSVWLDYSSSDTPLEAIRGQGLRIELDADETMTFDDLYSEQQKTIPIYYYRDSVLLFQGWLDAEGWHENWVDSKWQVSFDAIDGFGYLENLSFVENDTGLPISGRKTMLECISLALIRTGIQQNINADIRIYYDDLDPALSVLDNVYLNTERYIKDDTTTIMSCIEVLRDILEPFAACIVSRGGEWYIYKPNQLFLDTEINYFRYDYLGVALDPAKGTLETSFVLGSQVNGMYPHHCSANQQKNIRNSVGAYRINYKYGQAVGLTLNKYICFTDGVAQGWTVVGSDISHGQDSCGVSLPLRQLGDENEQLISDELTLEAGIVVKIVCKGQLNRYPTGTDCYFYYRITLEAGADTYYLDNNGVWQLNSPRELSRGSQQNIQFTITTSTEPLPVAGNVRLILLTAQGTLTTPTGGTVSGSVNISEYFIENEVDSGAVVDSGLEGQFHTVQRLDKPSSKVPDVKEVYTGDNVAENYIGALYKNNLNVPTSEWFRSGITESLPILHIMGAETLRMSAAPAIVFSGDVYGYFEYLSVVTIQGVKDAQGNDALFVVTEYSYDTKNNIITAKFVQIFGNELTDIDYIITLDYGKTVKPTVKG